MNNKDELIEYIKSNIADFDDKISKAWELLDKYRCPLRMADNGLYDEIANLIQDYADDNDLSEEWIDNIDVEELFIEL